MTDLDKHALFMELFLDCQHDIRAFVAAGIHGWDHVDDIMQEMAVILWNKFDDYDDQYSFGAWARGIARKLLLRHYEKQGKKAALLSDEALHAIEQAFYRQEQDLMDRDQEQQALHFCLDQLSERMREMIQLRYQHDYGIHQIEQKTGSKYEAIKKALTRVRKQLTQCCERHLQRSEHVS